MCLECTSNHSTDTESDSGKSTFDRRNEDSGNLDSILELDDSETDCIRNGATYHKAGSFRSNPPYYVPRDALYVPSAAVALQHRIVRTFHRSHPFLGAHTGRGQTEHAIRQRFFFRGMSKTVADMISTCEVCRLAKATNRKRHAMLQYHMDDQHAVLAYAWAYPLTSLEHTYLLSRFEEQVVYPFGTPRKLIADSELDSSTFGAFLQAHEAKLQIIASYNRQSNPVEHLNRRVEEAIRTFLLELEQRRSAVRAQLASFVDGRWSYILPQRCHFRCQSSHDGSVSF